jgi:hypothetical protein
MTLHPVAMGVLVTATRVYGRHDPDRGRPEQAIP